MIMASATQAPVIDVEAQSARVCRLARRYISIAIVACSFGQLALDSSLSNIVCTVTVGVASYLTFRFVLRPKVFRTAPLPTFAVMAFNISTMSGALISQTLSFRELIYNLKVPELTFGYCAVFQFFLLASLQIFISTDVFRRFSRTVTATAWKPLGVMTAPSAGQLWIIGLLGTAATAWTSTLNTDQVAYGDVAGKSVVALLFLSFAPFVIPVSGILVPGKVPKHKGLLVVGIALYFGLMVVAAVLRNSRGTLATGVTQMAMAFLLAFLMGQFVITKKLARQLMGGLLLLIIGSSLLTDISTAMLLARGERGKVSPVELMGKTFDAFWDKQRLEAYRNIHSLRIGKSDYDEEYSANPFLARFVQTKFTDNAMSYTTVMSGYYSSQVLDVTISKTMGLLPTPLIQALGINVDKSDIFYSMGDYLYYLEYAGGMGSFKVGSPLGHGMALMGPAFFVVVIPLSLLLFTALQSLTTTVAGRVMISPVIAMQLVDVFYILCGDSLLGGLSMMIRGLPQTIFLYLILFHSTRYMFAVFKPQRSTGVLNLAQNRFVRATQRLR